MDNIVDNSRTIKFIEELGTNSEASVLKLKSSKIGVYISYSWYNTQNGIIMLEFLIDILIRMFTTIIIEIEGMQIQEPGIHLYSLAQRAKSINRNIFIGSIDVCSASIMIGNSKKNKKCDIYISSNGWESYTGFEMIDINAENSSTNPIGAALSAAMGAAEIFKYVLRDEFKSANKKLKFNYTHLSAFDYSVNSRGTENPDLPEYINIGETTLIGAGAVGMAFVSVLKYLNVAGELVVVDNDKVDASNLDRYMGIYADSINVYKTDVVKNTLSHVHGLNITGINNKYQQYAENFGRFIDIAICTVDNDEARQELQSDLPRLILNGATDQSTFSISRHDFLHEACLGCVYPIEKNKFINEERFSRMLGIPVGNFTYRYENNVPLAEGDIERIKKHINSQEVNLSLKVGMTLRDFLADRDICGRIRLPGNYQIHGTIGFVSAMPGILLAGELIKERYFKKNVLNNLFHVNTLVGPSKNSLQLRHKIKECSSYCYDPIMVGVYKDKYKSSNNV